MKLVESTAEVIENAQEFSKVANGNSITYDRFSQFFHWYYFPELGLFAPSKFIGYKNTTISNYTGKGNVSKTLKINSVNSKIATGLNFSATVNLKKLTKYGGIQELMRTRSWG